MGFLPIFVDFYSIDGFYYPWHDFPFQLGSTNQLSSTKYKPAKYVQSCRVIPKCKPVVFVIKLALIITSHRTSSTISFLVFIALLSNHRQGFTYKMFYDFKLFQTSIFQKMTKCRLEKVNHTGRVMNHWWMMMHKCQNEWLLPGSYL